MASNGAEVAKLSVKVSPDTSHFRRELKRELDAIEKEVHAKVKVDPDTKGMRREIKNDLENLKGLKVSIADADTKGLRERIVDRLRGLKTNIDVQPNVNKEEARKQGEKAGNTFLGGFEKANKKAGGLSDLPSFGSGINPAGWGVILAGILAVAAPLIGLISTALISLPGLLAAVLTPIAAIALGLDGIKEAAKTLQQPFDDLKKVMSDTFQDRFTPIFEKLSTLFPTLKSAMPSIANGLADVAKSIVDMVTTPQNMAVIGDTIRNIGTAISASAPGIRDFVNSFLLLAQDFTSKLPDLAAWVNKNGKVFLDWIKDFTKKDWFGNSKFDKALDGLGKTLGIIIGAFVELGKKGLEFISDPAKMQGFIDGLNQIKTLLTEIMDLSTKLSAVGDLFSNFIPSFNLEGIKKDLFEPFTSPDAPWRTIWTEITTSASNCWNLVSTLVVGAVGIISQTLSGLGSTLSGIWNGVVAAAQGAVNGIIGAFSNVGSAISGVWNGIVGAAQSAWNGVVAAVQSAWEAVKAAVQAGIEAVVGFVSGMGGRIIGAITSIDLSGAGQAIMNGLLAGIKAGAEAVFNFVSGIAAKIKALKGPLPYDKKVLIPNGEALMDGLHSGIKSGLEDVLATAKDIANQIKQAVNSGGDLSGININADDLKTMVAAVEEEKKRLKVLKDSAPDKGSKKELQNQIDALQAQKDALNYQKDRLKNQGELNDKTGEDPFVKAASGLMNAPVDFAKATGKQFLSDIGLNGDGFISKALTEGIKYVFNIGSVDEAMSVKDRQENKEALAVTGRQ